MFLLIAFIHRIVTVAYHEFLTLATYDLKLCICRKKGLTEQSTIIGIRSHYTFLYYRLVFGMKQPFLAVRRIG